jgi:hypothetical protein
MVLGIKKQKRNHKKSQWIPKKDWFQPILWWANPSHSSCQSAHWSAEPASPKTRGSTIPKFTMFYGITTTKISMSWLWLAYSCSTMLYTNIIWITWLRMYIHLLHISAVLVQHKDLSFGINLSMHHLHRIPCIRWHPGVCIGHLGPCCENPPVG